MKSQTYEGTKFGRLTVTGRHTDARKVVCSCECGTVEHVVWRGVLTGGKATSCGCLRRELGVVLGASSRKHGQAVDGAMTVEYRTWGSMLSRCENPNHRDFHRYGGRGVAVCARWHSFENFFADMGPRPVGNHMSLDRIDGTKGYSPDNCRWADTFVQNNNLSSSRFIEAGGRRLTLAQWRREFGVGLSGHRIRARYTDDVISAEIHAMLAARDAGSPVLQD